MNKKGFTLIELLAVVTIIAIISLIAIPNIFRGIKEQKNKISETNMKLLAAATDTFIENNRNYDSNYEADGSVYCIPIQTLINNKLLDTPFKNTNGTEIDYSSQVKATYQAGYNSFNYELVDTCQEIKQYVSKPNLTENMIPVVYNEETNTWVKADKNTHWYNYSEKKWANAVLVRDIKGTEENSKNRYEYKEALAGTPILESDILAYLTWVPRFRYQLFESNDPSEINIIFENTSTPKSQGVAKDQWLTHPAFTYNNKELSGIWIGKYETSNDNNNPVIKSNKTPWTNIGYNDAANISNQMTNENNIYGLNNVNTHLTQNNEWAAAAYLTNSKYGLNDKVNTNTSTTTGGTNSTTGNVYGIYDMSGLSEEFVTLYNENENSLGSALTETKSWYNDNNTFITETNAYLTRGNTSIFNYSNSSIQNENVSFRITLINETTSSNEYIRPNLVTTGDGLYESTNEPGRYIYRGKKPNNYIWLDENGDDTKTSSEIYRIISYEPDGTIKVIRNQYKVKKAWDERNSSDHTIGPRRNENNTYCNYTIENDANYYGCNVWANQNNTYYNLQTLNTISSDYYFKSFLTDTSGTLENNENAGTVTVDSSLNTYLNNDWLNQTSISKYIANHDFSVGGILYGIYDTQYKGKNKGLLKEQQEEETYTWNGKIGLMDITDYVKASTNPSCDSIYSNYKYNVDYYYAETEGGSAKAHDPAEGWPCTNTEYNWMRIENLTEFSLTSYSYNRTGIWTIHTNGYFYGAYPSSVYAVRPSFYLKSSVVLEGEGTDTNPYTIVSY